MEESGQTKPKKSKSRSDKRVAKTARLSGGVEKLKTVVRRLPPNLPEEVFWQSVQPWVTSETTSWKVFYPGKVRKTYNKENVPSRAYISFKTAEQLSVFSSAYDGHVFRDKAGNESLAVVEFAPCQKAPPEKKKVDSRVATIEQDEDFTSFIESLKAPPTKPTDSEALEALIASTQPAPEPKTTPLLEALRADKLAQKDKETILKAHAHYHRDGRVTAQMDKGKGTALSKQADDGGAGRKGKRGGKKGEISKDNVLPVSTKGGPSKSGSSPAKPGRAPRERDTPSAAATTGSEANEAGRDTAKERDRRIRPAISFGIASRQFEAALSGAGVLSAGGGERKSRRERDKERKEAAASSASGPAAAESVAGASAKTDQDNSKPATSPSSNRDRPRGGGGGRRRGDGPKSPSLVPARSKTDAPPMILARIDDAPAPSPAPAKILSRPDASLSEAQGISDSPSRGGRGGGRGGGDGGRGRRRARGRGGPPSIARGSAADT